MDSALDSAAADLDADVEGVELRQMVEQSGKQTHGR